MSALATRSITTVSYEQLARRAQEFQSVNAASLAPQTLNSEISTSGEMPESSVSQYYDGYRLFRQVAVASLMMAAVSAGEDDQISRPLVGFEQISQLARNSNISAREQPQVLKSAWSRRRHRIRKAVREYSEDLNADYSASRK